MKKKFIVQPATSI